MGTGSGGTRYGDDKTTVDICEGSGYPDGETAEEVARATAQGNAMIRADYPGYPASRVVKRWITTGPWTPA
jgi:hypothetical protein